MKEWYGDIGSFPKELDVDLVRTTCFVVGEGLEGTSYFGLCNWGIELLYGSSIFFGIFTLSPFVLCNEFCPLLEFSVYLWAIERRFVVRLESPLCVFEFR